MMISIITVCYNNLPGLLRTYESIKSLRGDNFEWIVIDGGSSDGTKGFLSSVDLPRFKSISEPDDGIYNAMNKGISLAVGEYCIFMNSGDYFASEEILLIINESIGCSDYALIYGDSFEEACDSRYLKAARNPKFNFYSLFTHHQSIFYKTDCIRCGYDENYKVSADWALTTRVLRKTKYSAYHLNVPVSVFERGGISQQKTLRSKINKEHFKILIEEAGLPFLVAFVVWGGKVFINKFRESFPSLYDFLRYRN